MTYKQVLILVLISFIVASCSYKLLVDKRYVVRDTPGYLVFNEDEVVFFPTSDTLDVKFLADKSPKKGYKVEFATDWLDSLSTAYTDLLLLGNDRRLSLIPVKIRHYLGVDWQKNDEENAVEYKWDNEKHVLRYKIHDWRQILMISVVRESDRRRLNNLQFDSSPPHYR